MKNDKKGNCPETQHSRIYDRDCKTENPYTVLDNPDDRITGQNGDGATLVENDNPDDEEISRKG